MRMSWCWPSRAEDRFESWLAQRHEERVLAGETTPVGPCPDEAFLRDLARKAKRIAFVRPESRSRGKLSHVHESAACLPAGKSLTPAKNGARNRCGPLHSDRCDRHHGRSIWDAPATSIDGIGRSIRDGKPVGCRYDPRQPARLTAICVFAGSSGQGYDHPSALQPSRPIRRGRYAGSERKWRRGPEKRAGDDQWRPRISVCRTRPAGGQGGSVFSSHDPRTGSGVILLSFANQVSSPLRPLNSRLSSNPGICLGNRLKHSMNTNPSWQQMRFVCEQFSRRWPTFRY